MSHKSVLTNPPTVTSPKTTQITKLLPLVMQVGAGEAGTIISDLLVYALTRFHQLSIPEVRVRSDGQGTNWVSSAVFRRRLRQTGAGSNLAKSAKFGRLCEKPSAAGSVQPAPAAPPG